MLPDEILLKIFGFFVNKDKNGFQENGTEGWQTLVHVCQRWRSVVFGSPRRLDLALVCTGKSRLREKLDVWPDFPLIFHGGVDTRKDVDNIVAVLERSDRVKDFSLSVLNSSPWKKVMAVMRRPFPELTRLKLDWFGHLLEFTGYDEQAPVLPKSLLGASAPRLQYLSLCCFPFPSITDLLLSTTHLVDLDLCMPRSGDFSSGYFSPEELATSLSSLNSLESLSLVFHSFRCRNKRESRCPSPATRSVLPVLTCLLFQGASEFLDKLMAHIDAPQINNLTIILFEQSAFDTPQFSQFISRTPTLKALEKARVDFYNDTATVDFSSRTSGHVELKLKILYTTLYEQVSSLGHACTSCLPPLSALENLYVYEVPDPEEWRDPVETWLGLLRPFAAVKNLYLSEEAMPCIVPALHELDEGGMTEVLPVLQEIFLEQLQPSGSSKEGIRKVSATRQATNHPIAVTHWKNKRYDSDSDSD